MQQFIKAAQVAYEEDRPRSVQTLKDCMGDDRDQKEALLANILWFALDGESADHTTDQDLIDVLVSAARIADEMGVHWRSGR